MVLIYPNSYYTRTHVVTLVCIFHIPGGDFTNPQRNRRNHHQILDFRGQLWQNVCGPLAERISILVERKCIEKIRPYRLNSQVLFEKFTICIVNCQQHYHIFTKRDFTVYWRYLCNPNLSRPNVEYRAALSSVPMGLWWDTLRSPGHGVVEHNRQFDCQCNWYWSD